MNIIDILSLLKKDPVLIRLLINNPDLVIKELLRRTTGRAYKWNNLIIDGRGYFGIIRYTYLNKKNVELEEKQGWIYVKLKKYNLIIGAPKSKPSLLGVLNEGFPDLYPEYKLTKEDIKGKKVLDAGSFIGETILGFYYYGAKHIIGYEPIFYDIAKRNIEINNIKNAEIRSYGLGFENGEFYINLSNTTSGSNIGKNVIKVISFIDLLKNEEFDLAKIDIEGWEYSLLNVPNDLLRKIPFWVMEIHGFPGVLLNKFYKAGFKFEKIKEIKESNIYVYKFVIV